MQRWTWPYSQPASHHNSRLVQHQLFKVHGHVPFWLMGEKNERNLSESLSNFVVPLCIMHGIGTATTAYHQPLDLSLHHGWLLLLHRRRWRSYRRVPDYHHKSFTKNPYFSHALLLVLILDICRLVNASRALLMRCTNICSGRGRGTALVSSVHNVLIECNCQFSLIIIRLNFFLHFVLLSFDRSFMRPGYYSRSRKFHLALQCTVQHTCRSWTKLIEL